MEAVSVVALEYKENWSEARERYLAFWEHEIIDRACIAVTAPRENQVPVPEAPSAELVLTDIDYRLPAMNAHFRNVYYGGESIPALGCVLGYAVFGGKPRFVNYKPPLWHTIWIDPVIRDWERDAYDFDPHNKWCQRSLEMTRREYEDSPGKYLVALEGAMTPTDELSLLRGPSELAMDLLVFPDEVQETLAKLVAAFKWFNRERFEIMHAQEQGTASLAMWAPGRYVHLHCDFSCMISVEHYRKFVMPEMEALTQWLDHSFYHLDGADAIRHVPALLDLESLDGIQYRPATAYDHLPPKYWLPLYRQIQQGGKLLQISALREDVEWLLQELDPRGLFIVTGAPSIEAAEALLRDAERWSCRGLHLVP